MQSMKASPHAAAASSPKVSEYEESLVETNSLLSLQSPKIMLISCYIAL